MIATCDTVDQQYGGSQTTCETACALFTLGAQSDQGPQNTFYCRDYHRSVAATGVSAAMTHCDHTAAVSVTCNL